MVHAAKPMTAADVTTRSAILIMPKTDVIENCILIQHVNARKTKYTFHTARLNTEILKRHLTHQAGNPSRWFCCNKHYPKTSTDTASQHPQPANKIQHPSAPTKYKLIFVCDNPNTTRDALSQFDSITIERRWGFIIQSQSQTNFESLSQCSYQTYVDMTAPVSLHVYTKHSNTANQKKRHEHLEWRRKTTEIKMSFNMAEKRAYGHT